MDRPRVWRGGRDPFEEMGEEGQYPGASGHRKCWGGGRGTFSPVPTRSRQPNITNITADFFLIHLDFVVPQNYKLISSY